MRTCTDACLRIIVPIALAALARCSDDEGPATTHPDATAPARVTDLRAIAADTASITLVWTSTGDDGEEGTASHIGVLIAGGAFTLAGSVEVRNVAAWDGHEWSALGDGLPGFVNALTEYQQVSVKVLVAGHWRGRLWPGRANRSDRPRWRFGRSTRIWASWRGGGHGPA